MPPPESARSYSLWKHCQVTCEVEDPRFWKTPPGEGAPRDPPIEAPERTGISRHTRSSSERDADSGDEPD
jgi:hypothetical protein